MPVYDLTYEVTPNRLAWTIPGSMVAGPTTYPSYATWNSFNNTATPNNASGTTNGSDYYAGSGASGNYRASLFVNITPLSTGTGYTAISGNTAPSGNYRLRRVGGGLQAGVPGFIVGTINIRQPDNAGRRAIVVSPTEDTPTNQTQRSQDMIDAFGTTTPNNGGSWVLERETPGASTTEDEYRLLYNPQVPAMPNQTPSIDTTRWTALAPTPWNATEGFPTVGSLVTNGGQLFSSLNAISAITAGTTTYTQVFDFPAGGSTNVTQNVADYIGQLAAYRNALCVNNAHDSLLVTTGTYRLRRASGTSAATTGVTGNLYKRTAPYGGSGYVCFRIGSSESTAEAEMGAAFGTGSNITTGASWILERVNAPTVTPTATWRATAIATNGTARYNHTGMHLAISTTANSGAFPTNLTGTWRLQQAGTNRMVTGALTIVNPASGGVIDIRVGSASGMNTAFGPTAITSGGNFELIKTANAAPNVDTTNWSQVVTSVWDGNSAYSLNAVATVNTNYFRASVNIAAPTPTPHNLTWTRRTSLPTSGGVYAYDTDTGAMLWRNLTLPPSWQRNASDDISLGATGWLGGIATSTRLYFIDGSPTVARAFDHDGNRQAANDINLSSGSWQGGTSSSTRLYFINAVNNTAIAYDYSGNRQSSDDIALGSGSWTGGGSTSTRLYFIDNTANTAKAWDYSGNRQTSDDISLGSGVWTGGLSNSTLLFFIDAVSNMARAWNHNGTRNTSNDVNLGSGGWQGGAATSTVLYFVEFSGTTALAYTFQSSVPVITNSILLQNGQSLQRQNGQALELQ